MRVILTFSLDTASDAIYTRISPKKVTLEVPIMAYSPGLDKKYSGILRRFAWGIDKPMTKSTVELLDFLPHIVDKKLICKKCKDKTFCDQCVFRGRLKSIPTHIHRVLKGFR